MIKTKPKANSRRPATSVISCKVCVTILVVFSNTDYDSSFYRDKQYLFFCLFSMSGDQVDQTDHDHTRTRGMRKVGGNTVIAAQADKDNSLMCYLMHFDLISSRIQSRIQSVFQPYFGQVQGSLRAHFLLKKRLFTYKHTRLLGLCSTRGGGGGGLVCFSFPNSSVCKFRLLKFWTGRTLGKDEYFATKSPDQIDNGFTVILTSSLLC